MSPPAVRLYKGIYPFLAVIALSTLFLFVLHPIWWPLSLTIYLALILVALTRLVWNHARDTVYICRACGDQFTITPWQDLFSPNTLTQKLLRCPRCQQKTWAIVRERIQREESAGSMYS
jgi:DNA-directed RNA polymerase subunit RPC12/RpoP